MTKQAIDRVPMVLVWIVLAAALIGSLVFADAAYQVTDTPMPARMFIVSACGSCIGFLLVSIIIRMPTRA